MNKWTKVLKIGLIVIILLSLCGCLANDGNHTKDKPAGFLWGFWHGLISPIALIISLFRKEVGIYEVFNNGFWYNLGFLMSIYGAASGSCKSAHRSRCSKQ